MLRRILPMTFGLGIYYVDLTLSRRFLSELGEGAQSYFFWASRLCDFPQGIFVMALSTAALPSLATFAAKGDKEELAEHVGARHAPLALRRRAVQRGARSRSASRWSSCSSSAASSTRSPRSRRRARSRGRAAPSSPSSAVRQLVPAFHSLGDTRTPVIVSALDLDRVRRARALAARSLRARRREHGRRRLERRADGPALRRSEDARSAPSARASSCRRRRASRSRRWSPRSRGGGPRASSPAWAAGPSSARCRASPAWSVFGVLYFAVVWGLGSRELVELSGPIRRRLARRRPTRLGCPPSHGDTDESSHQRGPHQRGRVHRGRAEARADPRAGRPGDRVRRSLERRQVEPPQHDARAQGPRPHEPHAGLHAPDQFLRRRGRGRTEARLRRPARLRLREGLEGRVARLEEAPRGLSPGADPRSRRSSSSSTRAAASSRRSRISSSSSASARGSRSSSP